MADIIDVELPWDLQPQEAAGPNLELKPYFLWNAAVGEVDLFSNTPAIFPSTAVREPGAGGVGVRMSTASTERIRFPSAVAPAGDITVVVCYQNYASNIGPIFVAGKQLWSDSNGFYFRTAGSENAIEVNGGSTGFPTITVPGVGTADGKVKTLVVKYLGGNCYVWFNGVYCGSGATAAPGAWPAGIAIGNYAGTANNQGTPNVRYFAVGIVGGGDPVSLSANPWQLFTPDSIPVPVSAGGGPPPTFIPSWAYRKTRTIGAGVI